MEEEKNVEQQPQQKMWSIPRRGFIGFTIFDIIHIVCALALLIKVYASGSRDQLLAAECSVEIVFALLLVAFIDALAKHDTNVKVFRALYTFAWLTAVASLFLPMSFAIPRLVYFDSTDPVELAEFASDVIAMILTLSAFLLMLITMTGWKKATTWKKLMRVALILVICVSVAEFAMEFVGGHDTFNLIVECISDLAPMIPAIIGLTLIRNENFND